MKLVKRVNRHTIRDPFHTPYKNKIKKLNEEFHIYGRNNYEYLHTLETAFNQCIKDIENNSNLLSIDNSGLLFSKTTFRVKELEDIADDINKHINVSN